MFSGGQRVLLLCGEAQSPESLKTVVDNISKDVGTSGKVQVEHVDRLILCKYSYASRLTM